MKCTSFKSSSVLMVLSLLFSACYKDPMTEPSVSAEFQIIFSAESIPFTAIDSAKVTFSKSGSASLTKTFTKTSDLLQTNLTDLSTGSWTAAISIYSKKADNRTVVIYKNSLTVVTPVSADLKLAAPTLQPGSVWQVEVVSSDLLEVLFSSTSIALDKVDSVKMILTKPGAANREVKATKDGDRYLMDTHDLPAGDWSAECMTYARTTDFTQRIFIHTVPLTLPLNTSITLPAPTGKIDDTWEAYIVMLAMTDVKVIAAADNTNPFFEIQVKDPAKWAYFYKDRYAYNKVGTTNTLVESASWECQAQCYNVDGNKIRNTTAFANFSTHLTTKPWNNTEIKLLMVGKNQADDLTFYYKYDK